MQAIGIDSHAQQVSVPVGVKGIRCRTKQWNQRLVLDAMAKAECTYQHVVKVNDGYPVWRKGSVTMAYSGIGCGEEGQEGDLICYNWYKDVTNGKF